MEKIIYTKICSICFKEFRTNRQNKNICSWECKQEKARENSRIRMRELRAEIMEKRKLFRGVRWVKRYKHYLIKPCEVCGFDKVIDIHHEGKKRAFLCPNHHAMVSRGIKSLEELLKEKPTSTPNKK